jgi:phosphoribosyl 1,2-cyclic phosphodiesterase
MIEIKPLASSSAGNCYYVTDGQTALLLEAGISFKEIQRGTNFQMSSIAGCLITHEHGDHCKSAKDIAKAGIDIYASQGTLSALNLPSHRAYSIESQKQFTIGTWTILPFDVQHDVEEPLGFLLANQSGEKLLFATDTFYIRYRFSGITHLMIECNYSLKLVNERIQATSDPDKLQGLQYRRKRLIKSHFSLENMKEFIKANDLSKVQVIWLLHLSDDNSNAELFKREIQELTGKQVYIASK